jgi:hypothetical protein
VKLEPTQEVVLFETTAKASDAFKQYYLRHGTLRGAAFKAKRINGKANGRVLIQCKPADLNRVHLPQAPSVEKLLCHIWNIAPAQVSQEAVMTRPPAKTVAVDRTKPEHRNELEHAAQFVAKHSVLNRDQDETQRRHADGRPGPKSTNP